MEQKKVIIFTAGYFLNRGVYATLKELNFDVVLRLGLSENELIKALKNEHFDFFITNGKIIHLLTNKKLLGLLDGIQIILIGKEDCSFAPNLNIVKRFSMWQSKDEITAHCVDVFKEKVENQDNSEISEREKEIIKLVALGFTNKEIADKLFLSIHTVITHRKNISKKLGIKTISGLTIFAVLNGIISIDNKK